MYVYILPTYIYHITSKKKFFFVALKYKMHVLSVRAYKEFPNKRIVRNEQRTIFHNIRRHF